MVINARIHVQRNVFVAIKNVKPFVAIQNAIKLVVSFVSFVQNNALIFASIADAQRNATNPVIRNLATSLANRNLSVIIHVLVYAVKSVLKYAEYVIKIMKLFKFSLVMKQMKGPN